MLPQKLSWFCGRIRVGKRETLMKFIHTILQEEICVSSLSWESHGGPRKRIPLKQFVCMLFRSWIVGYLSETLKNYCKSIINDLFSVFITESTKSCLQYFRTFPAFITFVYLESDKINGINRLTLLLTLLWFINSQNQKYGRKAV